MLGGRRLSGHGGLGVDAGDDDTVPAQLGEEYGRRARGDLLCLYRARVWATMLMTAALDSGLRVHVLRQLSFGDGEGQGRCYLIEQCRAGDELDIGRDEARDQSRDSWAGCRGWST